MAWLSAALAAVALLVGCSGAGTLNALSGRTGYTLQADVPYGDLPRQKLDIYVPTTAAPAGGWPLVVFFYGGTWNSGERADYRFVGAALAAQGVLTLVADYRLYTEVRYPDFVVDSAKAVAYGLDQAKRLGANPRRVFVMGHSAGGYNAAMLALDARWLQAVGHRPQELAGRIGLAGPYDLFPTENPDVQPVFFHPNYPSGSQPIGYAPADAPPTFLGAAVDDPLVSPERSTLQMAGKLRAAGVPVTLRMYPRASHVTLIGAFAWPLRWAGPVLADVRAFIDAPRAPDARASRPAAD